MPLIVITLADQVAETPAGKPFTPVETPSFEIPVAFVVVCVIVGESAVLIHNVGLLDGAETVTAPVTVIVPTAFTTGAQPPVVGIE